jgi:hypothetical protein
MEFDVLLALHFIGLMMGAGGGLGSTIVMAQAGKMPAEDGRIVSRVGPAMARVSAIGLAIMLATGFGMMFVKYQGQFGAMPATFWWKMAFVATLTVAVGLIEMTYAQVKKGNVAAAARLPRIGPMAGLSAFLATIIAAFTFH